MTSIATALPSHSLLLLLFQVRVSCSEDQQCVNMSCNVSSIALSCLHLAPLADQVYEMWGSNQQQHCNFVTVPLWLGEILSDGYPDESTSNTLESILLDNLLVNCTIPYDGGDEVLKCTAVDLPNFF